MFGKKKPSQSEIDGVQYRRAKTWQIALAQMCSGANMCFYMLVGYANYVGNVGYGLLLATVGLILTGTRIFDAITDPIISFLIDKTNTRFGKIRIFMLGGWLLESTAILMLFSWMNGKGHGIVMFIVLYMLYIIGYTMSNMAGQIVSPILTNDPKLRPLVGVWATVYNYLVPIIISMGITVVILPRFGNEFTVPMLATAAMFCVTFSFVLMMLATIGISSIDKPENFKGISSERVKLKDMVSVLKSNRALQTYIVAQTSDKIAIQVAGQSIITTLLYGIVIGNMQLSTIINMIAMLPGIIFAILGARYAGKHGSKKSLVTWTKACIIGTLLLVVLFVVTQSQRIADVALLSGIYLILTLIVNSFKMCVTTSTNAMMADIIDYELDRSGNYMPGTVTGVYSLIDKIVSSLGSTIAALCVSIIGYTAVAPQPTDPWTPGIFWMALAISYGLPIVGWICTLVAMKFSPISKETMVEVQKRIADKKAAAKAAE